MIKYVIILLQLSISIFAIANPPQYYKLTRSQIKGKSSSNVTGGQFFKFIDNLCYETDIKGVGVGNGVLKMNKNYQNQSFSVYTGTCYYGNNVILKVNKERTVINIETENGDVYIYKQTTPPKGVNTCSLIKRRNSGLPINSYTNNGQGNNSYNQNIYNSQGSGNSNSISRQKTKVRRNCAYCNGRGERIQHESVTTFGLNGPKVHCNKCNQSWSYGTVHAHHRCSHCNGTGVYEYEY